MNARSWRKKVACGGHARDLFVAECLVRGHGLGRGHGHLRELVDAWDLGLGLGHGLGRGHIRELVVVRGRGLGLGLGRGLLLGWLLEKGLEGVLVGAMGPPVSSLSTAIVSADWCALEKVRNACGRLAFLLSQPA